MIRYIETLKFDEEKFVSYCSEADFDYAIDIGQKCKVITDELCVVGILLDVNESEDSFILQQNTGKRITIMCSDVNDIYCEEEIGTIN